MKLTLTGIRKAITVALLPVASVQGNCCLEYGINPPVVGENCGLIGELGFLYWKPYIDNNAFGYEVRPTQNNVQELFASNLEFKGNLTPKDVKYDWDSGFRVALGYSLPCDMWSVKAIWTRYDTLDNATQNVSSGYINPAFVVGAIAAVEDDVSATDSAFGEATADYSLCYNQFDLELTRDFYVGCSVTLSPYVGLRGLWILQTYKIDITNQYSGNNGDALVDIYNFHSDLRSDFRSLGLKGGFKTDFTFDCGLGIYGDFGASIVFGSYDDHHKLTASQKFSVDGDLDTMDNGFNEATFDRNALRAALDLAIGLKWFTTFNCDKNLVFIKLGWEHHVYFQQTGWITIQQPYNSDNMPQLIQNNNDLYLYGLIIQAGVEF